MQKTLPSQKKNLQLARKTPIAVTVAENPGYQCKKHHPRYPGISL